MDKHLRIIRETLDWVELNIEEDLNIVGISESFKISPWHFQRLFKSLVGSSLGDYIRGRKLSHAAQLLSNSDMGILDIGLRVGFNSNEAFTRSFKSFFKKTPKQFRKEKPGILQEVKPQLHDELLYFIREGIQTEPTIVEFPETQVIGYSTRIPSPFAVQDNFCDLVSQTWIRLINQLDVQPEYFTDKYYGISRSPSGHFTEDEINFFSAVPYNDKVKLDDDATIITLPSLKYAVFQSFQPIEEDVFNHTIDYIYGYWLNKSGYQRAIGDDLEIFDGRIDFHQPDFTTKYAIPILD